MRAWTLLSLACAAALAPPQAARRRSSRLRAAAPNDDPGPSDAALLDVALSRHLHAGIWAATFDGGEENRIALDAEGRASAVRDLYADGGGSGRGGARSGLWRIETVDGEPTACAVTVVLGRWRREPAANASAIDERLAAAEAKLARRPAPPPRYTRAALRAGRWLLDAVFENEPAQFVLDLRENGEFVDTAERGRLGGNWGVFDDGAARKAADGAGTHVWLWIRRSKCRGYNLHGDMRLHGRPSYGGGASLQRELAARSGRRARDRVAGFVIYGDIPDAGSSARSADAGRGAAAVAPRAAPHPERLGKLPHLNG
ncbi:hypothetical protein JL721_5981 [Aureococcus anophagefferens]|nr:hypothetical protein JL721_5981 [Aureococcus anophagefferens]